MNFDKWINQGVGYCNLRTEKDLYNRIVGPFEGPSFSFLLLLVTLVSF
jgi:hypothetical protein